MSAKPLIHTVSIACTTCGHPMNAISDHELQCDNLECSAFGKVFRAVVGQIDLKLEEAADHALASEGRPKQD